MELEELIEAAQQGDVPAFEVVCRRFEGLVKKTARQNHVRILSEEAMAEGWLAVAEAVRLYDRTAGVPAAGFIEQKVKFAVWNLFKRERRRWERELPLQASEAGEEETVHWLHNIADPCNVAELVLNKEAREVMLPALQALPGRQREAVVGTFLQGKGLAELAQIWQVSPQAVHNLRKRGLQRLKTAMAGMYESERG